jgi:chromate reductase, NAD(P)H dehydrogenase (quinone)
MPYQVAVLVGSLRKDSFNRKLAHALIALAPPSLTFHIVEIGDLSLFSQDLEATPPQPWVTFRRQIQAADAVLFFTPEYNRSVPGVLKNALDVASRPYGQGAIIGKPAAVISSSVGPTGGFGANHHLRQSLTFLNMPTLQQPEAYLGHIADCFNAAGELTNEKTRAFLATFAAAFAAWVQQHAKSPQ